MEKKELQILHAFRKNARENLTRTSRKTGIPVSTIYDRLKKYEGGLIKKHTALLDFTQLGFALKVLMSIKIQPSRQEEVLSFLQSHHRVNSLYKVTSAYDILLEGIFRNLKEYQEFTQAVDNFQPEARQEFFIIEDIKQEAFLSDPAFLEVVLQ